MLFHLKMTCTPCTDEVREKVPSFQKVTLFLRYKHNTEPLSVNVFVCLKMLLATVIYEESTSKVLFPSDSSFVLLNNIRQTFFSRLIIEIQLKLAIYIEICTALYTLLSATRH